MLRSLLLAFTSHSPNHYFVTNTETDGNRKDKSAAKSHQLHSELPAEPI